MTSINNNMGDKLKTFIATANQIHNGKYDYSEFEYSRSDRKGVIICPIHGGFLKTPNNHISGRQGCPKCSRKHRPTNEEFITAVSSMHNHRYDYSRTQYANNKTKVAVICPDHGEFLVTPTNHRNGDGCPKCGNRNKGTYHKKDTEWFITIANQIHGNKYDYAKVQYNRYHDKVCIVCPTHGEFFQTAGSHIHNRNGCPKCSLENIEGGYGVKRFQNNPQLKEEMGYLYVIELFNHNERFVKVGITKQIDKRFVGQLPYNHVLLTTVEGKMWDLFKQEQQLKSLFKQSKYRPNRKFSGHTECFCLNTKQLLLERLVS